MKTDNTNSKASAVATAEASDVTNIHNYTLTDDKTCSKIIQVKNPEPHTSIVARDPKKEYIALEVAKLVKRTGIPLNSAVEVIKSRICKELDNRDTLVFADRPNEFITVEKLLKAGDKYNCREFIEPLYPGYYQKENWFPGQIEECTLRFDKRSDPILLGGYCKEDPYPHYIFKHTKELKERSKFRFINANKLSGYLVSWLIYGYIEMIKLVLMIGAPGHFKSFLAIDMGLSISCGIDWHGHKVNQGSVLYICGEGKSGIHTRVAAWEKHHNQKVDNFYISTAPAQILSEESLAEIEAEARNIPDTHPEPTLIIIDTMNRNFGDGDENSTSDMTSFIKGLDRLSQRLGCAILVVHHTGLSDANRSRGSSALLGAMDFAYQCKVDGAKHISLISSKTKDHKSPEIKVFEPLDIQLGVDDDGNPISSVVIVETSAPLKNNKLSTAQRIALDALKTVIAKGDSTEGGWKVEAFAQNIAQTDNPDNKRKAFDRAKKALLDQGLIDVKDDKYSVL